MTEYPLVFVAVLAKQKEKMLPAWLKSLEQWDYPKDRVILYVRSNNNTDKSEAILEQWLSMNGKWHHLVVTDFSDIEEPVHKFDVHEWNPVRFKALGAIRERSVELALQSQAEFYWVIDVDNFVLPHTLRTLVGLNLPVVAPLLRYAVTPEEEQHKPYSNYHLLTNANGYYLDDARYYTVLNREITGLIKCDVVHCTYLLRRDVFKDVRYLDGSDDYEYVIFSRELRRQGIPQYLDSREVYGHLTLKENVDACVYWMKVLSESKAYSAIVA